MPQLIFMMNYIYLSIFLFSLLGFISLSIFSSLLLELKKIKKEINLESLKPKHFYLPYFIKTILYKKGVNYLLTNAVLAKETLKLISISTLLIFLLKILENGFLAIAISFLFIFCLNLSLKLKKILSKKVFYITSFLASLYLYLLFPFISLTFKFLKKLFSNKLLEKEFFFEEKFLDFISKSNIKRKIDSKILSSLVTFKEKVAREVMIPRIKVFALSSTTSIKDAGKLILEKKFSRIPVYRKKIDDIVGVIMYKDILKKCLKSIEMNSKTFVEDPIETLVKPIIYVPENKKISQLFQEFLSKKRHLAIVVDEYGGTQGIITMEDILEELVGEIQDEYDINEEKQLWKLSEESWIVDAKMSIIDLEKTLNIKIPHSPEYETIGGFVFHKAGVIPKKGWIMHHDEFEIEVLSSSDRCLEKIKITPLKTKNNFPS